jgi:2,3-dihydroxyphenylpropionate 1,2-dioxygenase
MEFVAVYAASHAGLILTRRTTGPAEQVGRIHGAFDTIRREISDSRPDALVVVATDHMRAFPLEQVPPFSVGVGPTAIGLQDAGAPPCEVPVHQALAQAILDGCIDRDVDLAFSEKVEIDHSFVVPLSLVTPGFDVPIVPIMQNCNVPPRPTFRRSYAVGRAVASAATDGPPGRAVLLVTGGLSHWVGSEERQRFIRRPAGTRILDRARFPVQLEDEGEINDEFDRLFLDMLASGQGRRFIDEWSPERVERVAGNGAHEIRNWLFAAGAVDDCPLEVIAYEPIRHWLTGTAVARFAA